MLVYVESNFVLELAFRQEQLGSCQALLGLRAEGRVRLVMPAFSVAEPFQTLIARARERKRLGESLEAQLGQFARSENLAAQAAALRPLTGLLVRSAEEEHSGLRDAMREILKSAELIPLDAGVIQEAALLEDSLQRSPQDAIVLASVLRHLGAGHSEESCFLNRNIKDFDSPDVVERLRTLRCRLIPRFDHGLAYVRSVTTSASQSEA
jgi:predicted nucleic acid-binding protein